MELDGEKPIIGELNEEDKSRDSFNGIQSEGQHPLPETVNIHTNTTGVSSNGVVDIIRAACCGAHQKKGRIFVVSRQYACLP